MTRQDDLKSIYREYRVDPAFEHMRGSSPFVPGRGSMRPVVVMVGEAPGGTEAAMRKPFKGPAGKVLDRLLADVGLTREQLFITNVVKYRPVIGQIQLRNRTPTREEIDASRPYLWRELQVFGESPAGVVTLGNTPLRALYRPDRSEHKSRVSEWHGHGWYDADRMYFSMYHPAVATYDPDRYDELLVDMKKMVEGFGIDTLSPSTEEVT
jgi:uracil-DNA glycosylase family 4